MSLRVHMLTFNPFEENTYLITAPSGECIIVDPGCSNALEQEQLETFVADEELRPVRLINTHCHIDHILGNAFVARTYGIGLGIHEGELGVLKAGSAVAAMYGLPYDISPDPGTWLKEGETISLDGTALQILLAPGHSPASVCFYNAADQWVIAGDVLFYESIGRTDLPGGDYDTLIRSIRTQLFTLPDETVVYPGHGPVTRIGYERMFNPFLQ